MARGLNMTRKHCIMDTTYNERMGAWKTSNGAPQDDLYGRMLAWWLVGGTLLLAIGYIVQDL